MDQKNTSPADIAGHAEYAAKSEYGEYARLLSVVRELRSDHGCPWDRAQTHESLKLMVIEEACEVIGGIDILEGTGSARNLKEELGDLLFQVVLHAAIAEEEGLFSMEDVCRAISEKMIRRHPHVFSSGSSGSAEKGSALPGSGLPGNELSGAAAPFGSNESWEMLKKGEKAGREWEREYLPGAFSEAKDLIVRAEVRKGFRK